MQVRSGKKGIAGSTLKMIAILIMLIDHIAAVILDRVILGGEAEALNRIYELDVWMRWIGRISFPIIAFLLVEGMLHTKNKIKYACNLGLFALISEIPFNLAFQGNMWDASYQNVFFTLFFGLLVLIGFQWIENKFDGPKVSQANLQSILKIAVLGTGMLLAALFQTDYGYWGVLAIAFMYLFRQNRFMEGAVGCTILCLMSTVELTSFASLIPICFYNGKRGLQMKYGFYLFYPLHPLILYWIALFMGIA